MRLELFTIDLSPFAQMVELQLGMKCVGYGRLMPEREVVRGGGFDPVNLLRKIPVLLVDGSPVAESQVMFYLIEELHPSPALLPEGLLERGRVRELVRIADIYLAAPLVQLFNNKKEADSSDVAALQLGLIERGLRGLEQWLGTGPYAAGATRTLADCALPPALFSLCEAMPALGVDGLPAPGRKAADYYAAVQDDEEIAACLARMRGTLRQRISQAA